MKDDAKVACIAAGVALYEISRAVVVDQNLLGGIANALLLLIFILIIARPSIHAVNKRNSAACAVSIALMLVVMAVSLTQFASANHLFMLVVQSAIYALTVEAVFALADLYFSPVS
ncbi:hypothetical protein [Oceanithermus profundus]